MLTELAVRDLGVFRETTLVLGAGYTALTGETGAGKSLVVGAIELLLGARADGSVVRPGASEAIIDGRFVDADGEELVLSRVIPADGRSRAYCNGRPVTVAELAERGAGLVELHGQHAHQRLLKPAAQRAALDRYAGIDLEPLRTARAAVATIEASLAELGGDEHARAREADLLRYQLDELVEAGLDDPDEDAALDREEDLLADAVEHQRAAAAAVNGLTEDDGVNDRLATIVGLLQGRAPFGDVVDRLRAVSAELADLTAELRGLVDGIEDDPERLATIRNRRQLLAELRRKYGPDLAAVIAERDEISRRLDELERHDETAAALAVDLAAATEVVEREAAVVAAGRRAAAPALAAEIQTRLRSLAMPHALVEVAVDGPGPADDVQFLLAANPGADPAPMSKVASGGELSRVTLALRLVLTAGPPSLVFDEVDAGIGGEAAWAVGRSLAAVSGNHQVLVVTHLPQVAAFADRQLHIHKTVDAGDATTTASVEVLADESRVRELARMLSGQPDSTSGREHAAELLAEAATARSEALVA